MKKSLKIFTLAFALMFVIVVKVDAAVCTDDTCEAKIGDVKYDTLQSAIAAAQSGDTVTLLKDVTDVTSTIAIRNEGTIIIDGAGYEVSGTSRKIFEVYAEDGDDEGEEVTTLAITFNNIDITTSYNGGRTIDTRTNNITLTVKNSTLTTTGSSNNQALTVGGSEGRVTVNVINTTIDAGSAGYGIITFNPVDLTIEESNIIGYTALYFKGKVESEGSNGSKVTVKNSTLTGKNDHSGESNNFGTIAFEDFGITLDIIDSTVASTGSGNASQVIFSEGEGTSTTDTNKVTISGDSVLDVRPEGFVTGKETMDISISVGVTSNITIPVEYVDTDSYEVIVDDNGNYVVVEKIVEAPNPNTGDSVVIFIVIGLISLISLAISTNKLRKNA